MSYKRKEKIISKKSIVGIFILLFLYILFPSTFQAFSQSVFSWYYDFNKTEVRNASNLKNAISVNEEILIPIFPIVFPPQTPYGFILAKFPVEYSEEIKNTQYVFTDKSLPIGYIEKTNGKLYLITLFSSQTSNEKFSIRDVVTDGIGNAGGSIVFEVPIESEVEIGDPALHLGTGGIAGHIIEIIEHPASNTKKILASLTSNPLQTNVYYIKRETSKKILEDEVSSILKTLNDSLNNDNEETDVEETSTEETSPEDENTDTKTGNEEENNDNETEENDV